MKIHRRTLWLWRSLALAGCSLPAGACVDAIVGEVDICDVDGKSYKLNEKFHASDGCNTCTCKIDGDVECTELSCSADAAVICDEKYGCSGAPGSLDGGTPYTSPNKIPNCENVHICPDAGAGNPPAACHYVCADAGSPAPVCDPKSGCTDANAAWGTCEYLGKTYRPGDTFRAGAGDGCSQCSCGYNGVECRDMVCYEPDGSVAPGTCDYAGTLYKPGDWFMASDNCNKCTCTDTSVVECTRLACYEPDGSVAPGTCDYAGTLYKPGDWFAANDSCNKCTCKDTSVVECTRSYCNTEAGAGPADAGVYDPNGKGSCNYMGKSYRVGDGFGKGDNCNKCQCVADGLIECSSNSCAATGCVFGNSKLVNFGQSVTCEDGCNTCTCDAKGSFTRTTRTCPGVPLVATCGAAMDPLAFPAPLVYVNGSSVGVSESRCVNGQSSDFSLCFDLSANTYEASLYVVPAGVTHACGGTERVFNLTLVAEAYRSATGQMNGKLLLRGNGDGLGYSF